MNPSTEPIQLVLSLLYITSLDASFMFGCVCSRYDFQCMFFIQIYRYTCAYSCTLLGIRLTTRGGVLTPLNLNVQILELGAFRFSRLLFRVAQRKRRSPADRPKAYHSKPPARLSSFPFVTCGIFCTVHIYISLCILAFASISDAILL